MGTSTFACSSVPLMITFFSRWIRRSQRANASLASVLVLIFGLLCSTAASAPQKPQIVPESFNISYSGTPPFPNWQENIYSTAGQPIYHLWLYPELDTSGHLVILNLILSDVGNYDYFSNLLLPQDFGLMPWGLLAFLWSSDRKQNPYGTHRRLATKTGNIVIELDVLGGSANSDKESLDGPGRTNTYWIDRIDFSVKVENAKD
jgi:hypothetical protein